MWAPDSDRANGRGGVAAARPMWRTRGQSRNRRRKAQECHLKLEEKHVAYDALDEMMMRSSAGCDNVMFYVIYYY